MGWVAFLALLGIVVATGIGLYETREQRKKAKALEEALRAEQARKKAAFDAWYASLPPHEQYMVDQQLAQGNTLKGIAAGMLANNMHDFMDH